jgi:hypothetical protein
VLTLTLIQYLPSLFDISESVLHPFHVSYWLTVLLFLVSYSGRRSSGCNRKTASIALSAFRGPPQKSVNDYVRDGIGTLATTLLQLEQLLLLLVRSLFQLESSQGQKFHAAFYRETLYKNILEKGFSYNLSLFYNPQIGRKVLLRREFLS